jgi:hypothetical protein
MDNAKLTLNKKIFCIFLKNILRLIATVCLVVGAGCSPGSPLVHVKRLDLSAELEFSLCTHRQIEAHVSSFCRQRKGSWTFSWKAFFIIFSNCNKQKSTVPVYIYPSGKLWNLASISSFTSGYHKTLVLHETSVADPDPGSGSFLPPGSGTGSGTNFFRIPDLGSRIQGVCFWWGRE